MEIKKNISLIVGMAIPVVMILFVAGSIYLPQLFVRERPSFSFVYSLDGRPYSHCQTFAVKNGVLTVVQLPLKSYPECEGRTEGSELYFYDMVKGESRSISFDEAKKLVFSSGLIAPDGFTIQSGMHNGGVFPFFFYSSPDYRTVYASGHGITKKLNIEMGDNYYDYGYLKFIGWVVPSAQ